MIAPEKLPATCWACQHNYRSAVLMAGRHRPRQGGEGREECLSR